MHRLGSWCGAIELETRRNAIAGPGTAGSQSDWGSLPTALLTEVFDVLLSDNSRTDFELSGTVRDWQSLALVCKHWRAAARAVPVVLALTRGPHLGPAARAWLSSVPIEGLLLSKATDYAGADGLLFSDEAFQASSARHLRMAVDVGAGVLPSLPAFTNLRQVSVFIGGAENAPLEVVSCAVFEELLSLRCLSITGHFLLVEMEDLPEQLAHLSVNVHRPEAVLQLSLPPALDLELLDVKAHMVMGDWDAVCASAEDVSIVAEVLLLAMYASDEGVQGGDGEPAGPPAQSVHGEGELALYGGFCSALLRGVARSVHVAFSRMALRADGDDFAAVPVDVELFLERLVGELLGRWDVSPAITLVEDWVGDQPSPEPCFVLDMARQRDGEPRSFTLTMPIGDREEGVLLEAPVARIAWCDDPRAPSLLSNPTFLQRSAGTLLELLHLPLTAGLDLSPFSSLQTLVGSVTAAPLHSITLPRSLQSLCLEAAGAGAHGPLEPDPPAPAHFEAEDLRFEAGGPAALREVGLYGFMGHNFAALPATVVSLRVVNPNLSPGAVIGGGASGYAFPDSWQFADSREDGGGSGCSTPYFSACSDSDSEEAASPSSAASLARDLEHGHDHGHDHGHGHGHGGAHQPSSSGQCTDPLCAIHSGKRSVYVSATEPGGGLAVDLSAVLRAGCQMLTINAPDSTAAHLNLLHDGSFEELEQALVASDIHALEINSYAARVTFNSAPSAARSLADRLFKGGSHAKPSVVPLEDAMQRFKDASAGTDKDWMLKSWSGGAVHEGVLSGSMGYALLRKLP